MNMTIGEVTAVLLYVRVIRNHNGSLIDNINTVEKVFGASYEICFLIVSPKKVYYEGDQRPESTEEELKIEEPQIKLDNVKYCYETSKDVEVLKGVSIDVLKNQIVAIVGHSGCGKSTIVSLLERFYDPSDGEVLFCG